MPLVGFKPTKARLVIEDSKESVLVMRVVVATGDTVELATGGKLEALTGVLRIRERKTNPLRINGNGVGSLVYIEESGRGQGYAAAKFQINIGMAADKFDSLLQVAISGRLPTKFFVSAGEKVSATETKGITYGVRRDGQIKVWDTQSHRTLPVTSFSMIMPIEVPDQGASPVPVQEALPAGSVATNAQVAELVDDLLVFQSETRNTLYAVISVVAIVTVLALVFGLVLLFR